MALPAGLTWEVRTTGNANNGGAFINLIPGTSVDYSQQNGAQLSKADLASVAASVTITSVTGGFTANMVGNVIQIRAGGVNFVAGFYEIVLFNSVNSVNLDRTPNSGNATGGLGEVGGALISPETFILSSVTGNLCYIKNGTYNFAASRTFISDSSRMFGYDIARNVVPTGNNRPLFALGAFFISTKDLGYAEFKNIRFSGSGTQIIYCDSQPGVFLNCQFENTNVAGTRSCINAPSRIQGLTVIDCEFSGRVTATSTGLNVGGMTTGYVSIFVGFNFFHDLNTGVIMDTQSRNPLFFKNIFARMGSTAIVGTYGAPNLDGFLVFFNSFYSAGSYHINSVQQSYNIIYGNTFDSAIAASLLDSGIVNRMWQIDNNDFWNNGTPTVNCYLGLGNIGLNPLWVNPAGNDFNFGPGSPNIDQALGIRIGV